MNKILLEVIDLEWEGPFEIQYDSNKDCYSLDGLPENILGKVGFYQIHGDHQVYGKGVLLYIGETEKGNSDRSFRDRLTEHITGRYYHHTGLSVYLAAYKHSVIVEMIESILINYHCPAHNSQHLHSMKSGTEKLLVRNWGFTGGLLHSCVGNFYL